LGGNVGLDNLIQTTLGTEIQSSMIIGCISATEILDEFYLKNFIKCRLVFCHAWQEKKNVMEQRSEQNSSNNSKTKLLSPIASTQLMKYISFENASAVTDTRDMARVFTSCDAYFTLKNYLMTELYLFKHNETLQHGKAKHRSKVGVSSGLKNDIQIRLCVTSSLRKVLPLPSSSGLSEHFFLSLWISELFNSYCSNFAASGNEQNHISAPTLSFIILSPLESQKQNKANKLQYKIQLYRFHENLLSVFGAAVLNSILSDSIPFETDIVEPEHANLSLPEVCNRSSAMSVLNDIIATIDTSCHRQHDADNIDKTLIGKYKRLQDLHNRDSNRVLFMEKRSNEIQNADQIACLNAIIRLPAILYERVVSNNVSVNDCMILVSVLICHGLLKGKYNIWKQSVSTFRIIHHNNASQSIDLHMIEYPTLLYSLMVCIPAAVVGGLALYQHINYPDMLSICVDSIIHLSTERHIGPGIVIHIIKGLITGTMKVLLKLNFNKIITVAEYGEISTVSIGGLRQPVAVLEMSISALWKLVCFELSLNIIIILFFLG
jgi:hypothetical protein